MLSVSYQGPTEVNDNQNLICIGYQNGNSSMERRSGDICGKESPASYMKHSQNDVMLYG